MRVDYVGRTEGLTLVVPVGKHDDWFLVTTADATPRPFFSTTTTASLPSIAPTTRITKGF